jgi:glycerophosphoryl diester phosphodiesterase
VSNAISSFPSLRFPRIVAHRGGGHLAPENTLAAMHKAVELGFKSVEFDVMLAACGTPIIIHDETLERTTDGNGRVADTTYADILKLDAGGWFSKEFAGERIPTFEQIIEYCIRTGLQPNIEIKPSRGAEKETGQAVAAMTASYWKNAARQPLVSSFSEIALQTAYETAPDLAYSLLFERIPDDWLSRVKKLHCVSLESSHNHLTQEQAQTIKKRGYGLLVYTINDIAKAQQLFAWGVDTIFTDRLDLISPDLC